nr:helix-turn-helix domain-containing protein [Cupriavidus sp. YR651]
MGGLSTRSIAAQLGRAASTISRELRRNGEFMAIAQITRIRSPGIELAAPRPASSSEAGLWRMSWQQAPASVVP